MGMDAEHACKYQMVFFLQETPRCAKFHSFNTLDIPMHQLRKRALWIILSLVSYESLPSSCVVCNTTAAGPVPPPVIAATDTKYDVAGCSALAVKVLGKWPATNARCDLNTGPPRMYSFVTLISKPCRSPLSLSLDGAVQVKSSACEDRAFTSRWVGGRLGAGVEKKKK